MRVELEHLWTRLKADPDAESRLHPARTDLPSAVPVVARGRTVALSPMLKERFEFCDRWEDGPLGVDWYNIADMREVWQSDHPIHTVLRYLSETATHSLLKTMDPARLSVFANNEELFDYVLLVWPEDEQGEPKVFAVHSNYQREFQNLQAYVDYLCEAYPAV